MHTSTTTAVANMSTDQTKVVCETVMRQWMEAVLASGEVHVRGRVGGRQLAVHSHGIKWRGI